MRRRSTSSVSVLAGRNNTALVAALCSCGLPRRRPDRRRRRHRAVATARRVFTSAERRAWWIWDWSAIRSDASAWLARAICSARLRAGDRQHRRGRGRRAAERERRHVGRSRRRRARRRDGWSSPAARRACSTPAAQTIGELTLERDRRDDRVGRGALRDGRQARRLPRSDRQRASTRSRSCRTRRRDFDDRRDRHP